MVRSNPKAAAPPAWPLLGVACALVASETHADILVETRRADVIIQGHAQDNRREGLGAALALFADFDGDGRRDLAIGAPYSDLAGASAGCVHIHAAANGQRLLTIPGPFPGALFGSALADAGDVDGDGVPDLLVGAPAHVDRINHPGSAYVYSGATASLIRIFHGEQEGTRIGRSFGAALDTAGDVDGDGHADLVIADPEFTDVSRPLVRGAVYIFSGKTSAQRFRFISPDPIDYFGSSVAGIGDADGDGRDDVAVGAPLSDGPASNPLTNCGRVRIYSGRNGQILADRSGLLPQERFGAAVEAAGDLDSDGSPEILVGAPSRREFGAGSALIFHGRLIEPVLRFEGIETGEEFGALVRNIGDVNSDGVDDFAIAAPRRGQIPVIIAPYFQPGAIDIHSGADGSLLSTITPQWRSSELFAIDVLGGFNADSDSASEILVGDVENNALLFRSPISCAEDFSGDGAVTALDIAILLTKWGQTSVRYSIAGEDVINAQDIAALLAAWGPCEE